MKLLPKMHFLEDHLLEWIKCYKVGMGLHGEQGGESLHATFNNLNRLHWNQQNPLKRLCLTMESRKSNIVGKVSKGNYWNLIDCICPLVIYMEFILFVILLIYYYFSKTVS